MGFSFIVVAEVENIVRFRTGEKTIWSAYRCERTPPDKRAIIAQKSLVFSFIGALLCKNLVLNYSRYM